jgi:hypothetical protein
MNANVPTTLVYSNADRDIVSVKVSTHPNYHIFAPCRLLQIRWQRQSFLTDCERNLTAAPSTGSVFLFLCRQIAFESESFSGRDACLRAAHVLAQKVEEKLPTLIKDQLDDVSSSPVSQETCRNKLVRACEVSRRFLDSRNRGILTAPAGSISCVFGDTERDKGVGSETRRECACISGRFCR